MPSPFFHASDLLKKASPFEQQQPPARLAVLGSSVTHSLSPKMHHAALQAMELPMQYIAIETKPEELKATLDLLRHSNFIGLNITFPHKQEALSLVDSISEQAQLLGAINTIIIHQGKLHGYNTDGPGFVTALKETWNLSLKNKRVLMLGATGGAGRALSAQCVLEGCAHLYLSGRRENALQQEAEQLSFLCQQRNISTTITSLLLEEKALSSILPQVDLIINATSCGMHPDDPLLIPSHLFQPHHYYYDLIYAPQETSLIKAAHNAGASTSNGLSLLLQQGALALELWFQKKAPLEVMREALRKEVS